MNGPPLKFKAVNTETGEEYGINCVSYSGLHTFTVENRHHEYSIWFEEYMNPEKTVLCQSTGLHDSKGQEIYFGNVVAWPYQNNPLPTPIYSVDWCLDMASIKLNCLIDDRWTYLEDVMGYVTMVGNRYQSREQLEAKAKEVLYEQD